MHEYSRQRGLKRLMIPVPFLSARLPSLWLGLVTPVYATIGRKLLESLKHPTVVNDNSAFKTFPLPSMPPQRFGGEQFGNRLVDCKSISVNLPADRTFAPIQRIGGTTGRY
jgi:hypothetical protein